MIFSNMKGLVIQKSVNITWPLLFKVKSHRKRLLQIAIVLGVLLVAPILGILATKFDPFIVLVFAVAPIVIVGLEYALKRPYLGPVIILIAAAFIPFSLPTGTESRLVDSLLLTMLFVGAWFGQMLLFEKRLSFRPSPVNAPILGFAIVVLISIVWSAAFRDPLVDPSALSSKFVFVQLASALVMITLPLAMLLVINHIDDVKWLKVMAVIMLLAGTIALVGILWRAPMPPVNDRGLFRMWVVSISVGLALFNKKLPWLWRGGLLVLAGGWLYVGFFQQITWLAGWLPVFIVGGILLFFRSKRLLFVLVAAGLIFISLNLNYYVGDVLGAETNESGNTRLVAWEANWQITGKHLLFGTGPAGYAAYYVAYLPAGIYKSHNNYIDIVAQTGVIGLIFAFWIFVAIARKGYNLIKRLRGRGDFAEGLANAAFAGTIGSIIMMFFGDWLFPFAYTGTIAGFDYIVYGWLFMGSIFVLDRLSNNSSEKQTGIENNDVII